ncbi:hypothetical protein EH230_04790 [Flavobacterium columnare]|uniref:Uncharacterized protein n=1 Tax=Flavobacterium columnare TaxID=996 RepID=A0A437U9G3_9FLAO|nr:hypothetical protein [Flavobacterium columnare]RVU90270.1 hypothetical protein EH230_04790 [Flavobacterium columnare]
MGGNAGIRGYLIQTIICVLDSLETDNRWTSVTLEPLDESEKVDIRWKYNNDEIKLCQVKSSENIIRHSAAKKWCEELEIHSPNANQYELIVIGNVDDKLSKTKDIGNVKVGEIKPLNVQILIDQASTKIDKYFESKNKPKISSQVRELIVKVLTLEFGTSSIIGKEISRNDFDTKLIEWITAVEKQLDTNPFASLAPPTENQNTPISHRIVKKILELIGWHQFGENHSVQKFNEKTEEEETHSINFLGDFESKLKEDSGDFMMISSLHSLKYPDSSKTDISKYLNDTDIVYSDLLDKRKIPIKRFESTDVYSLLFWLSTDNSEVSTDFIHYSKENYKRNLLNENINYFLIDNNKANFLISSITTAKNYRPDDPVKFAYPITEANQSPRRIGQRGTKLPAQFINSSIIPITKENHSSISFLLFCADPYSIETLKKLIWLTISLTSGFGNEYLIYFPDYDDKLNRNEALEVIRSFNQESLDEKVRILKYNNIDTDALDSLSNTKVITSKNETYIEDNHPSLIDSQHLNEAFVNILPYGDILKPFLKTDAITANDIKIFLAKKGIYTKNADIKKLIDLMSSLLFSPRELEDFKSYIDVKGKIVHSSPTFFNIKQDETLETVFKKVKINTDNLADGLDVKIINSDSLKLESNPAKDEFKLTLITETKDPTSSLLVNTKPGKAEVVIKKKDNQLVVVTENTISRADKYIVNRLVKIIEEEFKRIDFIEEEKIKVMFRNFSSNTERVNFLLSFSNIDSSVLFHEADIQSIKFKFDENTEIPVLYQDKVDKDLVINFEGKGLQTLTELSEKNAKGSIFLEEMRILYKFNYLNIKNGFYKVTYNFSNALKNKPEFDGVFKSAPYLIKTNSVKSLLSIENLEKELGKEIEKLIQEKLKQFNIIK